MTVAPSSSSPLRVAIIGGGITGLAAAHRLRELDKRIHISVFEAGKRLGGVLQTTYRDGYLIEHSADNFITNVPWAIDLARRIGFDKQLVPTDDRFRRAFVVHRGRLRTVPDGFALMAPARIWPVLTTGLLSLRGKIRLACEYFQRPQPAAGDESLKSFAVRRLGPEAYERIVQPLVGGIYTTDPEKLSLAATLPRFLEMEQKHGGLIRGALAQGRNDRKTDRQSSGARYSLFVAPREGMHSMVEAIAARIPRKSRRLQCAISRFERAADGSWNVVLEGCPFPEQFDRLILTGSATASAKLLSPWDDELARLLTEIPYAGASVVSLGYKRAAIDHRLNGFGFVVPIVENRRILAASFSSVKYPRRAPKEHELIRVFVGGAMQPHLAQLPDDELVELAHSELAELIGIRGEPELTHITRWHSAMPQYHLGHLDRVAQIEARVAALDGVELAGSAYHGVGVPQCIHSGEQAAQRALARNVQGGR